MSNPSFPNFQPKLHNVKNRKLKYTEKGRGEMVPKGAVFINAMTKMTLGDRNFGGSYFALVIYNHFVAFVNDEKYT